MTDVSVVLFIKIGHSNPELKEVGDLWVAILTNQIRLK